MRKPILIVLFAIAGGLSCFGVILAADWLAVTPRFPTFAGEDDFSLRITYYLAAVLPAFCLMGVWIGNTFTANKRVAAFMAGGVVAGTVIAFLAGYLLSPVLVALSSRDLANNGVLAFFLTWILCSALGAWVLGYAAREKRALA